MKESFKIKIFSKCALWGVFIFFVLFLSGCFQRTAHTAIDDIQNALYEGIGSDQAGISHVQGRTSQSSLPQSVTAALVPSLSPATETIQTQEKRFDIVVKDLSARTFFMGLVQGTRYNMIVSPSVEGKISVSLKDVTVEEAMEAVRDAYGYEYRRTPYGFEVLPREMLNQIFTVNYLDVTRKGRSQTVLRSSEISDVISSSSLGGTGIGTQNVTNSSIGQNAENASGGSVKTNTEADFWRGLEDTLKTIVGTKDGRSVIVNAQAGLVNVKAYPNELRNVGRFLARIQNSLQRQVVIEAKVLEVQLDDGFQSGIDWSLLGLQQTGATISEFTNIFTLKVSGNSRGSFASTIKLIGTQGNVQVLSSPRISTMNNQKAVIKVGDDEFFVTGVTTNTTIATSTTLPLNSSSVNLTPFFSGITLDVTPQVSSKGDITLHIHPSVSQVTEQTKNIDLGASGTLSLPLAKSSTRESDSVVRAKNGQVIVIGGLMVRNTSEQTQTTPGLTNIPFVGSFFRNNTQSSTKSELVILLRPVVTSDKAWGKDMSNSSRRIGKLNRGFHLGSAPSVFGTEGEYY